MKYAFIEQYRVQYPVRRMCPVIRVSRSGYYAWRGRPESVRSRFRRDLLNEIRRVHERFDERYGAVKCWRHLKREGIACGPGSGRETEASERPIQQTAAALRGDHPIQTDLSGRAGPTQPGI